MKKKERSEKWDGGYVRQEADGRKTYWIHRQVRGRRYEISTRCHTSGAAHDQLSKFESDPVAYELALHQAPVQEEPLYMDGPLLGTFLEWSRDEKKNDPSWVRDQTRYLRWWSKVLAGKDLRTLNLSEDVIEKLDGVKCRPHRIRVLRTFYSWLRTVRHKIALAEDPTFGRLMTPQAEPAQQTVRKAFPKETYFKVRKFLKGHWRDGADLLSATGWHARELKRFAEGGEAFEHPTAGLVLKGPKHKKGTPHPTAVHKSVYEAGQRLLARGTFDLHKFADAIKRASEQAELKEEEYLLPGQFRHSVATHAINAGADLKTVADFLHHDSGETTKRFYARHAVPAPVPTLQKSASAKLLVNVRRSRRTMG